MDKRGVALKGGMEGRGGMEGGGMEWRGGLSICFNGIEATS